jgi:hypothetical protein
LNLLPYWLVRLVALLVRSHPDQVATYKVFGGLVLYPLTWIAEAVLASRGTDNAWGALAVLAGPLTGWAALRFHEERGLLWREARAYLVLRTRKRVAAELRTRREEILRQVEDLAALHRSPLT